jgi:hypothetical protein
MAKNKISEYSATAANNTDIGGINIAEGCAPSGINNAIRELMAQLKDQQAGTDGDNFTVGGNLSVAGAMTCTGAAVFSSTVALGGSATATTQSSGDSTTKVATTAFVQATLAAAYPVGSIYINASSSTNPATLLGFGTWVAFGAGRVMVGLDAGNAAFDTAEETGGSADAITVSHTHTASSSPHQHSSIGYNGNGSTPYGTLSGQSSMGTWEPGGNNTTHVLTSSTTTSVTVDSAGSSGTNANLQPYIVVRMWKRTV